MFSKGLKSELKEEDLFFPPRKSKSSDLGKGLENFWKEELKCSKPSLWRALIKTFGPTFIRLSIFWCIMEALRCVSDFLLVKHYLLYSILQALALGQLMKYYMSSDSETSDRLAYVYTSVVALSALISSLTAHNYMQRMQHLGMCARVASCSLAYRKCLKLSRRALVRTNVGKMVNLLSNDVNRFDMAISQLMSLIMSPFLICIVLYILYAYVGPTACAGIAIYAVFIPFQSK